MSGCASLKGDMFQGVVCFYIVRCYLGDALCITGNENVPERVEMGVHMIEE